MIVTPDYVTRLKLISFAKVFVCLAAVCVFCWYAVPDRRYLYVLWPLAAVFAWMFYFGMTERVDKRLEIQELPFPPEWENILVNRVAFYGPLPTAERMRFKREMIIFLEEKPVVGVGVEIDETIRVLVAASAIIPIFGFPNWEYDMLDEVLVYPHFFDATFDENDGENLSASGMVATKGLANGVMILSKTDLEHGFRVYGDKHNVGIHEFAHLIDKATGDVDGVPVSLPAGCFKEWLRVVHEELQHNFDGKSDIDPYGFTSEEEFFAVVSEYFFESPENLKEKHPELYALMEKIYRQNRLRSNEAIHCKIFRGIRRRIRRNSPCPCGSGKKYKACCGKNL